MRRMAMLRPQMRMLVYFVLVRMLMRRVNVLPREIPISPNNERNYENSNECERRTPSRAHPEISRVGMHVHGIELSPPGHRASPWIVGIPSVMVKWHQFAGRFFSDCTRYPQEPPRLARIPSSQNSMVCGGDFT